MHSASSSRTPSTAALSTRSASQSWYQYGRNRSCSSPRTSLPQTVQTWLASSGSNRSSVPSSGQRPPARREQLLATRELVPAGLSGRGHLPQPVSVGHQRAARDGAPAVQRVGSHQDDHRSPRSASDYLCIVTGILLMSIYAQRTRRD